VEAASASTSRPAAAPAATAAASATALTAEAAATAAPRAAATRSRAASRPPLPATPALEATPRTAATSAATRRPRLPQAPSRPCYGCVPSPPATVSALRVDVCFAGRSARVARAKLIPGQQCRYEQSVFRAGWLAALLWRRLARTSRALPAACSLWGDGAEVELGHVVMPTQHC
jgi:hypothetical protein